MAYQPKWPHISPRADMGLLRLICHAIWVLACIILIYYIYIYIYKGQYIILLHRELNEKFHVSSLWGNRAD
jgi:hypothetical protein